MTILSVRSGSNSIPFSKTAFEICLAASRRAGRALLQALHESRMRAAARVFRDYAHLNAADQSVTARRPTPQQ